MFSAQIWLPLTPGAQAELPRQLALASFFFTFEKGVPTNAYVRILVFGGRRKHLSGYRTGVLLFCPCAHTPINIIIHLARLLFNRVNISSNSRHHSFYLLLIVNFFFFLSFFLFHLQPFVFIWILRLVVERDKQVPYLFSIYWETYYLLSLEGRKRGVRTF